MKVPGRYIIGGSSPHIHRLNPKFLETGIVIGLNRWMFKYGCEYNLIMDTENFFRGHQRIFEAAENYSLFGQLSKIVCSDEAEFIPVYHTLFKPINEIPPPVECGRPDGQLYFMSTVATAAIDFIHRLGGTEVYLYGVDLTGPVWEGHHDNVNSFLDVYLDHMRIYKTNKDSLLNVPYRDIS